MSFYFVEVVFFKITMRARPGASHNHQGTACLFRSLLFCDTCVAVPVCTDRWALDREEVSVADRRDRCRRVAVVTDSGYCRPVLSGMERSLGARLPIGDSGCRFRLYERDGRYGSPRWSLSLVYTVFAYYLVKPSKIIRIG